MKHSIAILVCLSVLLPLASSLLAATNLEYCNAYADGFFVGIGRFRMGTTHDDGHLKGSGKYTAYKMTLYTELTYGFMACGDSTFQELDIQIYDSNGKLLDKFGEPDNTPAFTFKPPANGEYYVVVYSKKGFGNYVLMKLYRQYS